MPRTGLEPARCETHAPETCASTNSATWAFFFDLRINLKALFRTLSGKRDLNSRPQPWQGCALPTELLPHCFIHLICEEEETRTPTTQLSLPPQSSASTNSATSPTYYVYLFPISMCPEQDSNLHVVKHTHLKRARLPIPPPGQLALRKQSFLSLSGKRDLNPRPQPWQGCALPTELLPHCEMLSEEAFLICGCKGSNIFRTTKTFQGKK